MPACALCENVQASGEACEVCGHPFASDQRTPLVVEPLEGLEPTSLPSVQAPGEGIPEFEATSIASVEVVATALEDLQPTQLDGIPDEEAEDAPSPTAVCRYCRNPAPAGEAFCGTCGMRLPGYPAGTEPPRAEVVLCRECSTPVKGTSCPACGARVPT
jgi:predicted amidophosphoribosyltransferase